MMKTSFTLIIRAYMFSSSSEKHGLGFGLALDKVLCYVFGIGLVCEGLHPPNTIPIVFVMRKTTNLDSANDTMMVATII